ncbi:hypothetical protein Tco_1265981 [Tanacetum coccineum]
MEEMQKSNNKESDYGDTKMPEKQSEKNIEDGMIGGIVQIIEMVVVVAGSSWSTLFGDDDIYKDQGVLNTFSVVEKNSFVNPYPETGKTKAENLSPTKETTPQTETPPPQTETTPPQTHEEETTPQRSPAKSNESTEIASRESSEMEENDEENETKENDGEENDEENDGEENDAKDNDAEDNETTKEDTAYKNIAKKRKRAEIESPGRTTRAAAKKQQLEKKVKEPVKKRKRVEKPKKEAEKSKKMVKKKGKKKLKDEDEDEDYDIAERKKDIEKKFKSLRARATVKPLYLATKSLTLERKTIIRQMGFGSMLDFQFDKIPSKIPYFVLKNLNTKTMEVSFPSGSKLKITPRKIWEVLGIPMGKNKLESDSPRDDQDQFINDFKAQFGDKKFITTTDLSKQIQRTTNTDFMFQMNYLMLFSNCIIHCDNSSRLVNYVLRNIKSTPQMKIDMEITQCKWPEIRNWTYEDLVDREMIKMLNGKIGLVEVLEDDHEENENAEKNKLKEVDELFNGDEKLGLFVERFKKEFNKGMDIDENNAGSSGAAFWEDNEDTNMTTLDQNANEREPSEKEEAKKEAAAKEREEAEKQKNQKRKEQVAAKKKEE